MKICLRCNLTYEDHQKFCKNCGQQLQNIDGDLNYNEQDNSQKKKKVKQKKSGKKTGIKILMGMLVLGIGIAGGVFGTITYFNHRREIVEFMTPEFKIGETWVENGLWKITVNSVTETSKRDELGEELELYENTPSAVYIVNYTYENLGYESEVTDGLYVPLALYGDIIDASGKECQYYTYSVADLNEPEHIKVGDKITAEEAIAVDTPGTFTIKFALSDGKGEEEKIRRANFLCEVP